MPLPHEHSARLKDPSRYVRFRRENDAFGSGIDAIWGITKDGRAELQAIRFDAEKFTADEAKAWLKKHGHTPIRFEEAAGRRRQAAGEKELDPAVCSPPPVVSPEFLLIEAADGNDASGGFKVIGVAYSGGKMSLPGWRHPVVVDLAGMEIPESVPLLTNHENRTGSRVGVIRARVEDGALVVEGEILSSSGQAQGIVEQARAGADWQMSMGAEVKEAELVRSKRTVNGIEHSGPFYHVKRSMLREVSVVAVGADASTRMKLAAQFTLYGGLDMDFERWLKEHGIEVEALDEERKAKLKAAFDAGEEPPELRDEGRGAGGEKTQPDTKDAPGNPNPQTSHLNPARAVEAGAKQDKPAAGTIGTAPPSAPQTVPAVKAVAVNTAVTPPGAGAREEAEKAVRNERERVAAIQELCAGEFPRLERDAVRLGWSMDETSQKVLKAMRESRPQADIGVAVHAHDGAAYDRRTMEAALCLRAGISGDALAKDYGEQVVESARRSQDLSLHQLFMECARLEGVPVSRAFSNDTIRAGFSTVSLPGILNNVANKKLLKSFQAQPVVATRICSAGELNDFKESERYRLTDVGDLEPVAPDGELKHGGLREEKATNQLGTFGKIFALTRQMIYNDDLGAFLKVPEGMGARAARKIDQLFFKRLLANPVQGDGKALFHADHRNFRDGVETALSADSLAQAVQMFLDQTDADGQPINVNPKFLMVPTTLKMTAREILNSTFFFATGGTDRRRIPTYNALADEDLEVVSSPYLSNANYTGASQKAWFLFADPAVVDTFEIGYLKGRRTPTVEQGETDFDTLGIKFRVYFDLGVREQDYRGMVKFVGENNNGE